ncbi:MAG: hypothetical protein ACJA2S_001613, partial [Cyclobacteriaceae bacterium]
MNPIKVISQETVVENTNKWEIPTCALHLSINNISSRWDSVTNFYNLCYRYFVPLGHWFLFHI